jgi:GT2 family glycosyltransferase/peptidoglycan/xylan/chitin deacetylase (PgdA/CDA1 family)
MMIINKTRLRLDDQRAWGPQKSPVQELFDDVGIRAVSTMGAALDGVLGSRAQGAFGILMYHRIAEEVAGVAKPSINVTPGRFREQIAGLVERDFVFWPLRRVLALTRQGKPIPSHVTVLTFDDGFENVYTHAWPVLKEFKVPATIFASTAYIDSAAPFPFDRWGVKHRDRVPALSYAPLKDWQYNEMQASGLIEIGAHTHTHQDFRRRPEDFHDDLRVSVEFLRSRFGQQEVSFAFPFGTPRLGFTDADMVDAAKAAGVTCGLTTASELVPQEADPFCWGRFNAFPWDSGATLAAKLNGWYSWAPRRQQRVRESIKRVKRWWNGGPDLENTSGDGVAAHPDDESTAAPGLEMSLSSAPTDTERTKTTSISIIVPTFNRADWLREAVESLENQVTDGRFTYEIVVIDNASTDATRDTAIELAESSRVPVKYFYQPISGDAPTRNMGIRNSEGQWLAFFDDDQFADPEWLRELHNAACTTEAAVIGGPVHLDLPPQQLEYLGPLCRKALREIAFYPALHPYLKKHLPGTGNALVKRAVFDDLGMFDESMTSGGSDHDFFLRAREARYVLWYTPSAIIRHRIPASRLTEAYFRWDALTGGAGCAAHFDYKMRGRSWMLTMCAVRLGHAVLLTLPALLLGWFRGDEGEVLGRRTVLWRAEGYARKTLAVIAPRLFAQQRFFASLEFRNGRTIGQELAESESDEPTLQETTT